MNNEENEGFFDNFRLPPPDDKLSTKNYKLLD